MYEVVFRQKETNRTKKLADGKTKKDTVFPTVSLMVRFNLCFDRPSPGKSPGR